MQLLKKFGALSTSFASNRSGNFAMMLAVTAPVLLGISGVAINFAQLINARSSMQSALDSAITSTARDLTTGVINIADANDTIAAFLSANGSAGMSEADKLDIVDFEVNRTTRVVTAAAHSDVKLAFPMFFGIPDTYPITVNASASYADQPVEIAMMLDLTGSMNERGTPKDGRRQTKLDNLKDAASMAVEEMLQRNRAGQAPRIRVALVPYSQGVNAGAFSNATYIEDPRIQAEPVGLNDLDLPINAPIKLVQNALRPVTDNCTTERKVASGSGTAIDLSDDAPGAAMINRDIRLPRNSCPTSAVVPLTADRDALLDAISNFSGRGGTAGHIGIQWTRYMLSPKWGSFLRSHGLDDAVPGSANRGRSSVRKVAILLTDGEFNTAYVGRQSSATYAQSHCTAMKSDTEVFTIGFMLNDNTAKATMANCASPDTNGVRHYYEVSSAAELDAAFRAIAANTETVQLTN